MADALTMQQLVDGGLDANTLEAAVNEDRWITSRLGAEFASVPMASRLLVENGLLGATPYETYAAMTSNTTMVNGDYAVVTNDTDLSRNGVYVRSLGGYKFLKYNNLSQAKTYTDAQLALNDPSTRSFPMSDGVVTLPADYADNRIIYLTGTITETATLQLPKKVASYIIHNLTVGNNTVLVKTVDDSKTGIEIQRGEIKQVFNSGADTREVNNYAAPLRSPAFVGNPTTPNPAYGERTKEVANADYVWGAARASSIIALTGNDVTLTNNESFAKSLVFTGTLTKDVVVTIPHASGDWNLRNATTGGFKVSIRGTGQSSAYVDVLSQQNVSCFGISSVIRTISSGNTAQTRETKSLKAVSSTLVATAPNNIPIELSRDGMRVFNASSRYLKYSDDWGVTWTNYRDVGSSTNADWVRILDNSEMLIHTTNTTTTPWVKQLWLSSGFSNPATATWTKVFDYTKDGSSLNGSWGFSNYNNIVLIAEYGGKVGYPTSGLPNGAPEGENARYVYMSLDYGKTWHIVFDLNTHATTTGVHTHGVAYDAWWQRIWVTYGDSSNATMYSDDLGVTWKIADYYGASGSVTQMVGIKPMKDCILFGSDTAPNGIHRINRSEGKQTTNGKYKIEVAYKINESTSLNYLCHSIFQARHHPDAPVFFGFGAEIASVPSVVLVTYDGYHIEKLWQDAINNPIGRGVRNVIGVTPKNEVIVASNDERVVGKWSQITIKV